MACGSAADGPAAQQLRGDEFDRPPVSFLSEKVFGLGQQAALEPFAPLFAGRCTANCWTYC